MSATIAASTTLMEHRFRLVELQKEELKVQAKIDDYNMWGAPGLDQASYQKKGTMQRGTAHSKRGSIFWALVERTPAHDGGVFGEDNDVSDDDVVPGKDMLLCHCESHMFDCAFRKLDGTLVCGISHHIGSVFTLPAFRGQGLARLFLTGVQKRMSKLPNAIGSVLYSDIGPTFFDRLGWRLHPSVLAELKLSASLNDRVVAEDAHIEKLYLDKTLDEFLARDNQRVLDEMVTDKYSGKEVFASLLTRDSVEWHFCLGVLYANIRGFPEPPTYCGAEIDNHAFVVWCHNLKESTLYIVHARFPVGRPSDTVRLLRAAITEAGKFKLASVAIWDPTDALFEDGVLKELSIVKEDREGSLSSLVVFDQYRVDQANKEIPVWLNNEKHAWV